MAEAMLRSKLEAGGFSDVEVASAGILAIENLPASRRVEAALNKYDLSAVGHRSHQLSQADTSWADLIVGFEVAHIKYVRKNFEDAAHKTATLRLLIGDDLLGSQTQTKIKQTQIFDFVFDLGEISYLDQNLEVDDPDRGGDIEMQKCADQISGLIDSFYRGWFKI